MVVRNGTAGWGRQEKGSVTERCGGKSTDAVWIAWLKLVKERAVQFYEFG